MSDKINLLHQTMGPVYGSVGHELLLKIVVSTADFKDYIVEWKLNGQNVPADQVSDIDQSLYIPEMTEQQFGTYTARIKLKDNPLDYVEIKPILVERRIWIKPAEQSPTHIKVRVGEGLRLFATPVVESNKHTLRIWYKDGVLLTDDKLDSGMIVSIQRMKKEDFGTYTCKVFVQEDARSHYWIDPIVVEENTSAPVIHLEEHYQPSVTVPEDGRLDLEVSVKSDDATRSLSYAWIHNGKMVIEQDGNALIIPYVRKKDAGIWRLEVKQANTTVYSKDCNVIVSGRSFFRISQQPATTNVGNLALALFKVDYETNYANAKVQWYRKKKNEPEFKPMPLEKNKELHITPATTELNESEYKARMTYGENNFVDSEVATLLVGPSPTINITEQPQALTNVRITSSQSLICKAETEYEHYRLDYQWYKDGELLPGKKSNALHFSSITKADEGQYQCKVSMGIQDHRIIQESNTVQVTVDISKPTLEITVQPKAVNVRSGGSWVLTVTATSNDALPVRYRWFKDGVDLLPPGIEQRNVYGEDHAQLTSTGIYSCRVSAGIGEQRVSRMTESVRVLVTDDPKIVPNDLTVTVHPQNAHVSYNKRVMLHAEASTTIGVKPSYQWMKDGEVIPGATSNVLVIEHAKPSDVGTYHAVIQAAEKIVKTDPAVISMAPHTNINILKHPVDVVAKEGQKQDIKLEAHAEHIDDEKALQWQWRKIQNGKDTPIAGATEKVYTIPKAQIKKDTHQATYYAEIKDDEGHVKLSEKVRVVFTTATLKRYVHPIPWRRTSFQYQGYWVMDEIDRCNNEGLNWLEDFEHTKYPEEIETIAASLHHYSNTHVLESRNGYLVDGTQLF